MSTPSRPPLASLNSAVEFERWYWLKQELIAFCRAKGLSTAGSKQDISSRIAAAFRGQATPSASPARRRSPMPSDFEPATVIGHGWVCSQALRAFFVVQVGPGFRFNEPLRTFIRQCPGSTLSEAVEHHRQSLKEPRPIAGQFEYNRHTREFFEANPGTTKDRAIAAWWAKRGRPMA